MVHQSSSEIVESFFLKQIIEFPVILVCMGHASALEHCEDALTRVHVSSTRHAISHVHCFESARTSDREHVGSIISFHRSSVRTFNL